MFEKNNLTLNFKSRLGLFICITLIGLIICSIFSMVALSIWGENTSAVRISTIIQDLILFIAPAIIISLFITRLPADFLLLRNKVSLTSIILTAFILILSVPMMNFIVHCNESIAFPDSLKGFENIIKSMEQKSQQSIDILLGFKNNPSVINLIMSILIVGLLTGLSEELFFRGALQNLFHTRPMNIHYAIWITAVIFSAMHFQFYGFVPRVLIGAFFGYLAVWSGSLWLPVFAHALNNSLVVLSTWLLARNSLTIDINKVGTEASSTSATLIAISAIATTLGIIVLYKHLHNKKIN